MNLIVLLGIVGAIVMVIGLFGMARSFCQILFIRADPDSTNSSNIDKTVSSIYQHISSMYIWLIVMLSGSIAFFIYIYIATSTIQRRTIDDANRQLQELKDNGSIIMPNKDVKLSNYTKSGKYIRFNIAVGSSDGKPVDTLTSSIDNTKKSDNSDDISDQLADIDRQLADLLGTNDKSDCQPAEVKSS